MDALSLSSSLSISKPFCCLPLSNKQQRPSHLNLAVSCRATKLKGLEYESSSGNFYKMLCLSPKSATTDEIRRAYRSMALQYHPDVCHDPSMKEQSTRMFVQLNAAYETLSNPMLKAQYDCELGLESKMNVSDDDDDGECWKSRWQEQVVELKTRSRRRMEQKGGSWSGRMRTQNKRKDRN